MISILVSHVDESEYKVISEMISHVSFELKEEVNMIKWDSLEPIEQMIEGITTLDAAIIDVTVPGGIEAAKRLRYRYNSIELMIISNASISPITYLNPTIKASSLLLKPFDMSLMKETVTSFFELFDESDSEAYYYVVQSNSEHFRVPYNKIYYFEARDKKVYLRLSSVEYYTNNTIEYLADMLPAFFIRCHRSFITNRQLIEAVHYGKNVIVMEQGMNVPISRTYKSAVKEAMKNEK